MLLRAEAHRQLADGIKRTEEEQWFTYKASRTPTNQHP